MDSLFLGSGPPRLAGQRGFLERCSVGSQHVVGRRSRRFLREKILVKALGESVRNLNMKSGVCGRLEDVFLPPRPLFVWE